MTRHSVTVRLHHTDAAGVLFYSRLFELVQEAFETAMETAGLPLGELLRDGGFRIPVVHAQADYRAPVRVGDVLEVGLSFAAGNRSLRVGADFVDAAGRQVAAVTRRARRGQRRPPARRCRFRTRCGRWRDDSRMAARLPAPARNRRRAMRRPLPGLCPIG